jgi:hypothetical protein
LINNVGPSNFEVTSSSAAHHVSFKYFVTAEQAIASEPKTVTSFPWMSEAENICLSRKMQIER